MWKMRPFLFYILNILLWQIHSFHSFMVDGRRQRKKTGCICFFLCVAPHISLTHTLNTYRCVLFPFSSKITHWIFVFSQRGQTIDTQNLVIAFINMFLPKLYNKLHWNSLSSFYFLFISYFNFFYSLNFGVCCLNGSHHNFMICHTNRNGTLEKRKIQLHFRFQCFK